MKSLSENAVRKCTFGNGSPVVFETKKEGTVPAGLEVWKCNVCGGCWSYSETREYCPECGGDGEWECDSWEMTPWEEAGADAERIGV